MKAMPSQVYHHHLFTGLCLHFSYTCLSKQWANKSSNTKSEESGRQTWGLGPIFCTSHIICVYKNEGLALATGLKAVNAPTLHLTTWGCQYSDTPRTHSWPGLGNSTVSFQSCSIFHSILSSSGAAPRSAHRGSF